MTDDDAKRSVGCLLFLVFAFGCGVGTVAASVGSIVVWLLTRT